MHALFSKLSRRTAEVMGTPNAFIVAVLVILAWAVTGPIFGFSNTWQLLINTGTTIITFLMVILIQNTQNHDAKAFHLKLDELIRADRGARNDLVDLEAMTDAELDALQQEFIRVRDEAVRRKNKRKNSGPVDGDIA
jgi:low affinity Fe/Cu permease